jgi:uncharacterized protein (DUF2132 family)
MSALSSKNLRSEFKHIFLYGLVVSMEGSHINKDPLHGITLKMMLVDLVEHYGWDVLGDSIKINCFRSDPSVSSSLKFLRRTPWAREKVESLYCKMKCIDED